MCCDFSERVAKFVISSRVGSECTAVHSHLQFSTSVEDYAARSSVLYMKAAAPACKKIIKFATSPRLAAPLVARCCPFPPYQVSTSLQMSLKVCNFSGRHSSCQELLVCLVLLLK